MTIAPVLGEATVQELRESVRGEIVTPDDSGYTEASKVWNGLHDDRRPAMVIRCQGVADVIAAVGFARGNDLPIAVRGGGHSVAGFSTVDDGVVIDLGPMSGVRVDPQARRATVGGGAVWADVDHETQAHGLATTGGLVSTTGVAGFTLGGGIGWTMRKFGLACDNLAAADVVTSYGELVHASATENPELLWGLRGGGGNFGIVTQFELELHPLGPMIYAGPIFYPAAAAGDLLLAFRDWAGDAPDEITALVNLTTAPPLPVIPEEWHGNKVAALIAASTGPVDEGEALVRAFREVAEPIADLLGPMPTGASRPSSTRCGRRASSRTSSRPISVASTTSSSTRCARSTSPRPDRSARSMSTRWVARSPASATTRRRSPSARCRTSSTRSPAGRTQPRPRRTGT